MNLYAETSAVMAWLFDEDAADKVEAALKTADFVLASELTLVECDRVLFRAQVTGELSEFEIARRRSLLETISSKWSLLKIDSEIMERARRRFPEEPVKALDSLHLSSLVAARSAISDVALLSLDKRVRDNGIALGFDVLPG